MNSLIDSLNLWGERWLSLAWPMLWQSSLLIALLFGFDLAVRRRLRAAIRYALWLVVLVKLVLPPTLALPTGLAWWLPQSTPAPTAKPQPTFVVTYSDAPVRRVLPVAVTPYVPPPPKLTLEGWALLAWAGVGFGLFGWMGVRWWQVARDVRRAAPGEPWLEDLVATTQREAGLRGRLRLRLTERPMSPAVCGLIQPVILLPRGLVERLPPAQLRAVLLHELVHLRRGDVWANCLQALLQIGYWWHPLVWLANARIRRVREEAVDDAVMLALRDEADHYAPTLLEVAKLAFRRPLASLGLVGILESRSALRQRIERLVDFQPPRRAGLSVVAGLGIASFAAVAVPMGEAPVKVQSPTPIAPANAETNAVSGPLPQAADFPPPLLPGSPTHTPLITRVFRFDGEAFEANVRQRAGLSEAADMPQLSEALRKVFAQLGVDLQPPKALIYSGLKQKVQRLLVRATPAELDTIGVFIAGLQESPTWSPARDPVPTVSAGGVGDAEKLGVQTVRTLKSPAQEAASLVKDGKLLLELGRLNEAEAKLKAALKISPDSGVVSYYLDQVRNARNRQGIQRYARTNLLYTGKGRQSIISKLNRISFEQTEAYDGLPLSEVVSRLIDESKRRDPDKRGVNFIINPTVGPPPQPVESLAADATTGQPVQPDSNPREVNVPSIPIKLPALADVTLSQLLDAIVKAAEPPIKYAIEEYAVVFSLRGQEIQPLTTRVFRVDPKTLHEGLDSAGAFKSGSASKEGGPGQRFIVRTNDQKEVHAAMLNYFASLGVDLKPPKSLFWNDRAGRLIVHATQEDLDVIQSAIQFLNEAPPQINIQSKFVEMPEEAYRDFCATVSLTENPVATNWTAILSAEQMRDVVKDLEQREGTDLLMTPEVTTLTERQAQVQAVEIRTIVTRINPQALTAPGVASLDGTNGLFQSQPVSCGPVLDVLPTVTADGYCIELTASPTVTEFLGYDKPEQDVAVLVSGVSTNATRPLPRFRVRQATAHAIVRDGQTLVISGISPIEVFTKPDGESATEAGKETGRRLVVLVTPTIIDPAGNRVHPAGEKAFAREGLPAQSPR